MAWMGFSHVMTCDMCLAWLLLVSSTVADAYHFYILKYSLGTWVMIILHSVGQKWLWVLNQLARSVV